MLHSPQHVNKKLKSSDTLPRFPAVINLMTAFVYCFNIGATSSNQALTPELFFDANESSLDQKLENHSFRGNVIAITSKIIISADELVYEKKANLIMANGNVLVISPRQIVSGISMVLDISSGEFTLTQAMIASNDAQNLSLLQNQILGFTTSELEFERQRRQTLAALSVSKSELRESYKNREEPNQREEIINKYVVLLEKEQLISRQKNASLSKLTREKRESVLRRRAYWQTSRNSSLSTLPGINSIGYFVVEGDWLKRIDSDRFLAKRAFFTPCFCQKDESAPWGFRAEKISAQGEAYATLEHPVLEIKGIPVLYFPFLKIPIKSRRQSGFLPPNISHSNLNGTTFTQPIFLAFSQNSDATFTPEIIEKRGLKLGLELRSQNKQHSGWSLEIDSIRDELWLIEKENRRQLINDFKRGLETAREYIASSPSNSKGLSKEHPEYMSVSDPGWWTKNRRGHCLDDDNYQNCIAHEIRNKLSLPSNSWRGMFRWNNQWIIAPRLNFVSQGSILSDHRYLQDLWKPLTAGLGERSEMELYSISRAKLHLDAEDFYLGLGTNIADPVNAIERFSGYQNPLQLKAQSKMIRVFDKISPFPLYLQSSFDHRQIEVFKDTIFEKTIKKDIALQRLGNGSWQRYSLHLNSPLMNDQIINADFFSDFEYRSVNVDRLHRVYHHLSDLAESHFGPTTISGSLLHTADYGIHINLPLRGVATLGETSHLALNHPKNRSTVVQHDMSWDVTMSMRSYVVRRGRYGTTTERLLYDVNSQTWNNIPGNHLTYFPSDRTLDPDQKVVFSTKHEWSYFDQYWKKNEGQAKKSLNRKKEPSTQSPRQKMRMQAEEELRYSLEGPIRAISEIFNEDGTYAGQRYLLSSDRPVKPLRFESEISFDYLKVKKREIVSENNLTTKTPAKLPEPWSPLKSLANLQLKGWQLNSQSDFNIYKSIFTQLNFSLSPPPILNSLLSFSYNISNTPLSSVDDKADSVLSTRTRSVHLSTRAFPTININLGYSIQKKDIADFQQSANVNLTYTSPTRCWGFNSGWKKDFSDKFWQEGTYFLGLVVHFFKEKRVFGNMASQINNSNPSS